MADKVEFIINIGGTAYKGVVDLDKVVGKLNATSTKTTSLFDRIGASAIKMNSIFQLAKSTIGAVTSAFNGYAQANQMQVEAETRLAQVMRNTIGASDEEIQSIKDLTAAQQKLGIVGDEVQLAGAQELGTYVAKTDTLSKLIPAMNDMIAQQYGFNATQESAVNIATMMGKVMEGQTGALSRYGYSFTEAQEQILKFGTEEQKAATLAEVIEQAVGGVNKALAETPEGKMKQVSNAMGDIRERIGNVVVRIEGALMPVVEKVVSWFEGAVSTIETSISSVVQWITSHADTISSILSGIFNVVTTVLGTVFRILKGVIGFVSGAISLLSDIYPIILGVAGAITILTVAMNTAKIAMLAQEVMLNILIIKEAIVAGATKIWTGAQALLNAVMAANPIVLIVAGIMILVGAIVWVCSKITGWGSLWKGVVGFMKYSFYAFIDGIKAYFLTWAEGFMIGLDKIRLGWYKFKEALGIGDSAENQAAIVEINEDVERRKQVVRDAADKVTENAAKAKESLQGIEMGWKKSEKSTSDGGLKDKLGINGQLEASVNGGLDGKDGKDGKAYSKIQDVVSPTTNAIATGGTRNTTVNINLGKMVESINFNGSVGENAGDIERKFEELFLRVLYMAQNA